MFEYLMPLLVMPTYENTLLDQTYRAAVERQIEYGRQRGVPWGMSESGYNTVDVHLNYQYRAFGVPGLGLEARAWRGPGRGAVRVGARPDGRARSGVPQPAASRRRRPGRKARLVRGHRLHAVAAAPRRVERRGPVVHGAPPGDEPALLRLRASGAADAKALRVGPAHCRRRCCFSRSAFQEPRCFIRTRTELSDLRAAGGRPGVAGARARRPRHGDSGSAVAVERPLSRDGHECRRRKQPLEGPGRDPLARRRHLRQLGHVLLPPRRGERRSSGRPRISRRSSRQTTTRRSFPKAGQSFGAGISISRRTPRSWSRPKTISRSAASTSRTGRAPPGRSTSRATRRWFSRRRPRTHCIRRSATSSCKPRSSRPDAQFFAPGVRARAKSRCRGCST